MTRTQREKITEDVGFWSIFALAWLVLELPWLPRRLICWRRGHTYVSQLCQHPVGERGPIGVTFCAYCTKTL